MADRVPSEARVIGRYALHDEIAAGGMATVHFGRLLGQAGFSRTVAIKRLHAHFAKDPDFVSMFVDEARLAARIHHPNVVSTLDVVARDGELFLVMDYISGEPLSKLMRHAANRGERIAPRIAVAIVAGFLHGLHAAHEARNERGEPLEIVHRDVSPQNVLVGVDGVPRVVDFGVAKASGRVQTTQDGQLKGKPSYMAPEQIHGMEVSRRTDVYAASIVLWEVLTGQRLFSGPNQAAVMLTALSATPDPPSARAPGIPQELDRITLRGLSRKPDARFQTARDMALELEAAIDLAHPSEVGAWVQSVAGSALTARATLVAEIESTSGLELHLRSEPPPANEQSAVSARTEALATRGREASHRGRLAIALGLAGVMAVLLVFVVAGRRSDAPAQSMPVAPDLPPSTVSSGGLPSPEPAAPSAASVAPREVAAPSAPTPPASRSSPAPRAVAPGPARAATPGRCDPPYRVDASGRKIFRMECL